MLPIPVRNRCQEVLNTTIEKVTLLSGGDINEARLLQTDSGRYFLKMNTHPAALDMFETEAAGLQLIKDTQAIQSPLVLDCGQAGNTSFLLLEFIPSGHQTQNFWTNFGTALALMHQAPQKSYGLSFNNYIGSLPQVNPLLDDWPTFYHLARLLPQLQLAKNAQRLTSQDIHQFDRLFRKLPDLLPNEAPALIHGDLWSGNFLSNLHEKGVLIDPAICCAHREMDIAMSKLFGGFAPSFYQAYQAAFPLLHGWEERIPLYQLYYLMVHVNLFGGGYVQSVRQVLQQFS
jgi:fructosamine-3-kinase